MNTVAYKIGENLYLNITNECTNKCTFCIRNFTSKLNDKYDLWLDHEPDFEEIQKAIGDPTKYNEIVFCGYGEPLIRLEMVKNISKSLKEKGCKIRIDSNGQANLFHKKNIVPELKGLIDTISISLNSSSKEQYQKICQSQFGEAAFNALLEFAEECKKYIPNVMFSVVGMPDVDIIKCENISKKLDIPLKVRKYYEQDYAGYK